MISTFANSFKSLTLYNASPKSSLASALTTQLRDIHLQQPMLKSIEEKLGIPEKPKRPITPYFRFMNEIRSSVKVKNPKLKQVELTVIMGKMWKSLDASKKEKFAKSFKDEMLSFTDTMAKYKKGLTEDDVRKIKETKAEMKERKFTLMQQKKSRSLGKPKKPLNSFLIYLQMQTDRKANEEYKNYLKRVSIRWQALSESEQEKYRPQPDELENYRKELAQWETKMRKLGHYDIISGENVESITSPASSKTRSRKSSSP